MSITKSDDNDQNKKRLEEEAKEDKRALEARQKIQEKNRLQLKLGNLKNDFQKLQGDLGFKETKLQNEKRNEEDAKRKIFDEQTEERKLAQEIGELKTKIDATKREIDDLTQKINQIR